MIRLEQMADENPLQDPLRFDRRVPPCAIVIFGANGDLAKRKLVPALYRLFYERRISQNFAMVGSSRTEIPDDQFREKMKEAVQKFLEDAPFDESVWNSFAQSLFYVAGDVQDQACYEAISKKLEEVESSHQTAGNVLFYLSTQPSLYAEVVEHLGASHLETGKGWRRVIIEKPFGHDLTSARKLSEDVHKVLDESQVYRIDHYLGKETVQNILAFRFGNSIFEPLWSRRFIDHVQITASESIGVEGRGGYYQEAGALRDMIQNHLSQVMATVTMEPPTFFDAESVRDERAKLLKAIRIMSPDEVKKFAVSGQYGPATVGGENLAGFRQEKGVDPESQTDTYAAVTFHIDNWRWGWRAFLYTNGQAHAKARYRHRHSIRIGADRPVSAGDENRTDDTAAQFDDSAHPARRRNLTPLPVEESRWRHEGSSRVDGLQLRFKLWGTNADGVRNTAGRCHGGRSHLVQPSGHG